ncbi:MAG: hypothetical protein AAGF07_01480 [Patescibacteria group bacterium]
MSILPNSEVLLLLFIMKRKLIYFTVVLLAVIVTALLLFNPMSPRRSAAKAEFSWKQVFSGRM